MLFVECIVEFIGAVIIGMIGVFTENAFLAGTAITVCSFIAFKSNLSKGSFNPTITLAMVLTKKQSWRDVSFYILSQFVGAFAVWLLYIKYH